MWGNPKTSTPICNFIPDTFSPRHSPFLRQYQHFECFWNQRSAWLSASYARFSPARLPPTCAGLYQEHWLHLRLGLTICHNGSAHFAILENHAEWPAMYILLLADTKLRKTGHISYICGDVFSFLPPPIPYVFLQIVPGWCHLDSFFSSVSTPFCPTIFCPTIISHSWVVG